MAKLRFAILQTVRDNQAKVVLEYDQDILLLKLRAGVRNNLMPLQRWNKKKFTDEEVKEAVGQAFDELIKEFKDETVRLV